MALPSFCFDGYSGISETLCYSGGDWWLMGSGNYSSSSNTSSSRFYRCSSILAVLVILVINSRGLGFYFNGRTSRASLR